MTLIDATKKKTPKTVKEIAASNAPGSNVARALLKADPNYTIGQPAPAKTKQGGEPAPAKTKQGGQYVSGELSNSTIDTFEKKGVVEGGYVPNTRLRLTPDGRLVKDDEPTYVEDTKQRQINDLKKNEETPNIAVDNGTARDDEKKTQKEITYQSQRTPLDLTYLQEAERQAKKSLNEGESNINAGFDVLRRGQEAIQAKETGAMSAGLARAGGYLGFTSSGESMMISLEKSHRAEMLDLEAKRSQALSQARQAYNDQMYDVAREKQKLATAYEEQQYQEKQAYFAEVKRIQQEEAKAKDQERANMDIYSAIQGGAKNEFDVFSAIKGKATPEQIQSFFKAVGPKTTESDVFKPTNTQTAMLMGAGFGADDIQTIYDHLNEYGYDDVLKASLTPYQRRVMDDMLTMKPEKPKVTEYAPTNDMKEYEYAKANGYEGTFEEWKNNDKSDGIESKKPTFAGEKLDLGSKDVGYFDKTFGNGVSAYQENVDKLATLGISSDDLDQVISLLEQGYSLKQIAQDTDMPSSAYEALSEYITTE